MFNYQPGPYLLTYFITNPVLTLCWYIIIMVLSSVDKFNYQPVLYPLLTCLIINLVLIFCWHISLSTRSLSSVDIFYCQKSWSSVETFNYQPGLYPLLIYFIYKLVLIYGRCDSLSIPCLSLVDMLNYHPGSTKSALQNILPNI